VAIGGLSGSGKTTIARAIAHYIGAAPGAIHVRSDVTRKKMMDLDPLEHLGSEGYDPEVSERTYEAIRCQATAVLEQGHAAILDAVHDTTEARRAARQVAEVAGRCFVGLWLEAPTATRVERVSGRGPDASDADTDFVRRQARNDPGPIDWHRINTDRPVKLVVSEIASVLAQAANPHQ
jgi:predicted kinase